MKAVLLSGFAVSAFLGALASCSSEDNPAPTVTPPVPGADAGSPSADGGPSACTSTSATCNSCTTTVDDPYNACSSAVGGCVPFDNDTRVPRGPDGQIPKVP